MPLPESGGPIVAQIPITTPKGKVVESVTVLFPNRDLLLYDLGKMTLRNVYTGAEILRHSTNWRSFSLEGTPLGEEFTPENVFRLELLGLSEEKPQEIKLHSVERLADGVEIRYEVRFQKSAGMVVETLRIPRDGRHLIRTLRSMAWLGVRLPKEPRWTLTPGTGIRLTQNESDNTLVLGLEGQRRADMATLTLDLPPAKSPPAAKPLLNVLVPTDDGPPGSLERPGYRAIAYPRPKTSTGEDRIMPVARGGAPRATAESSSPPPSSASSSS